MKRTGIISTAILFLLLGTTAPAYAQHGQKGGGGQGKSQARGQQHQQRMQQPRQQRANNGAQRQGRSQASYRGVRSNGRAYGSVRQSSVHYNRGLHNGWGQSRARSWNSEHRTWSQRGGYVGYRVPQDRYNLYFGSNHYFRMNGLPVTYVGGYPRFQYNGYGVQFADPWPQTWPATWYQTDNVYLNYNNDGYYLYNRNRPGPGIAVNLSY